MHDAGSGSFTICTPTLSAVLQARRYAKAAGPPGGASTSSNANRAAGQSGQQQWKPKQPLATAQTLTLFSETPQGLLIALKSTLQSMASLASRVGPPPNTSSDSRADHDHVLLYALSKDLPSQYLSEAVSLLRGDDSTSSAQPSSTASSPSRIARVGILSSPLPSSLIPSNALEPGTPPIASSTLHSVSLSLLPGVNAIPFRSTIPGRADIAVGRWVDKKPSWQQGTERRADLLDDGNGALPGGARDWKDIWGRENLEGKVPEGLEKLGQHEAASFLFFSDTSAHGLMEGLATQFPASSILGLTAPPTPFETGRDQTILLSRPGGKQPSSNIYDSGAVGVALVAARDHKTQQSSADRALPIPSGLKPFGPRRQVSAAQGNIISSLDGANAAQQFLRDIQNRADVGSSSAGASSVEEQAQQMSEEIASRVKKEEDFFIAIYSSPAVADKAGSNEDPLLILSGHPSRGTLSIDTQVDLGPGPGNEQGTMNTSACTPRAPSALTISKLAQPSPIEIPGPNPSDWITPRFLFLALPTSSDAASSASAQSSQSQQSGNASNGNKQQKHKVMALPNLFVAASERGWIAGKGRKSPRDNDQDNKPNNVLSTDGATVVNCTVPLARAMLSLRAE
ncbi:LOW QUALITY PROTEIN: hypothetical protein BCV70DRAFT_212470 [Testicularia cyperi]|uniref:FIST domain-containing protein n=1 Tax=Testicularia cyperi TaxID=1882483 RepID=A0A317XM04_9BASI|nr:LOW QUALITY PROTEIN: hypothetical protein BCV70DRAFT_212470 [Testicularia cyperi]